MQLVNHEVMKLRRDVPGFMPGEIGFPNDTVAGKRHLQLPGVGGTLEILAAIPHHVEHITLSVAHTGYKTPPMAVLVRSEQAGVIALTVVDLADDVQCTGMGRPDAKSGAIGDEVRTQEAGIADILMYWSHHAAGRARRGSSSGQGKVAEASTPWRVPVQPLNFEPRQGRYQHGP